MTHQDNGKGLNMRPIDQVMGDLKKAQVEAAKAAEAVNKLKNEIAEIYDAAKAALEVANS